MNRKGIIFDIQRCSLHDGPGIRTTIFLKGCPLRCVWCHNPESQQFNPQIAWKKDQCVNCFTCIEVCLQKAHKADGGVHVLEYRLCNTCGKCLSVCPNGALKVYGYSCDVDSIMAEVEKDLEYYRNSNGGVTLSGGEPMAQLEFTAEILRACKMMGIHTCIETCGHAPKENYDRILEDVDLFLFDYKETDSMKHKALTGVSNERILANLGYLYESGASMILRCPLVPGINDSKAHLEGIAGLFARYPGLAGIELMAYHSMGVGKGNEIGQKSSLQDIETASEEVKQQ